MISKLADFFFDGALGKLALGAGLFAAMFTWWQVDRASQRHIGRLEERVATEAKNDDAVKRADEIGARSRNPAARGMRDPYAGPDVGADIGQQPQVPAGL